MGSDGARLLAARIHGSSALVARVASFHRPTARLTSLRSSLYHSTTLDIAAHSSHWSKSSGTVPKARLRKSRYVSHVRGRSGENGFVHAACGPFVRSSYHADQQAHLAGVDVKSVAPGERPLL